MMRTFGMLSGLFLLMLLFTLTSCQGTTKRAASPKDLWVITTPSGQVDGPLRVEVVFSQPMVAAAGIGATDNPPLTIKPKVEGRAEWTDERTLVFVASETLPSATEFVASVPSGTRSLSGHRLAEGHTFAFSTARLTGTFTVAGRETRAVADQKMSLEFNQRVDFNQITEHCRFKSNTQSRTPKLAGDPGPAKRFIVAPSAPLSLATAWKFECTAALRGSEGTLGLAETVSKSFSTYGKLTFNGSNVANASIVPDERNSINLHFSNPLGEPYKINISPKVRGFPEQCYSRGDREPGLSCSLPLEPKTRYTITVDRAQKDVFGQSVEKAEPIAFQTKDAPPGISLESGFFVAELRRPVLPVWTRNAKTLQITTAKVTPKNFNEVRAMIKWWEREPANLEKLKRVKKMSTTRNVAGIENQWAQHAVDPAALLGEKRGPGMYYVEIGTPDVDEYTYNKGGRQKTLVNFTDIGVVSKLSASKGIVWVTRLSTGKPIANARVTAHGKGGKVVWSGRTSRNGIATLPPLAKLTKRLSAARENDWEAPPINLFVRSGKDFTMVNGRKPGGLSAWNFNIATDYSKAETKLRGFMHTDRGLYRPGETVHIKGIARESRLGARLTVPKERSVSVEVKGPRGKMVHTTKATLSPFGGFDFDLDLAGDSRLGDYTVVAKLAGGTFSRRFAVEEFRPSTFEVSGKSSSQQIVHRGRIEASVEAKYFYGAPLRSGKARITVHKRPRRVSFSGHGGFRFGDNRSDSRYHDASRFTQDLVTEDNVKLDSSGRASISIAVGPGDMTKDVDLLVNAAVSSPANEVINKRFAIPYFRSKRYFGIKSAETFIETGKEKTLELLAVDPSGKALAGSAKLSIVRRDWNCVWEDWGYRGSYRCKNIEEPIASTKVNFKAGKATPFRFTAKRGGEYWVILQGGENDAVAARRLYAWGSDGGSWRSDDGMTFEIAADKEEYRAGDTAALILKTDLADATGLVTIERDGVIEQRFVHVTSKNKRVSIPIKAAHAPNVYVSVALVQGRKGNGVRGKPRMKMGMVNLPVRPEGTELKVSVATDESDYRPGADVTAKVRVTDHAGRPVSAEVSLVAADEGVLSLIGFKTPDPLPSFYAPWGLGVTTATQFAFIRDIPSPGKSRPATGGDSGAPGSLRSRFMATAVWSPRVVTNGNGVATARFKAPDNLTAFRVMAVAADKGHRFGSGDKRFTVSKPVQLHRSLPRFLTLDDKLLGGVIVHNETKRAGTAVISIATSKALSVNANTIRRVEIPAGGRVPVLWDITAQELGIAELTFAVALAGEKDAVRFELPVHHPSPERRLLVKAGATKTSESIALTLPASAVPKFTSVHISVDPSGLAGIEEGLRDLVGYPYGCLEQTTSKVLPMIAVRGLVESLNLNGLTGTKIDEFVKAGIEKIGRHQTRGGGFSLWPGGTAERYYTAYALWGLHLAKKAGYKVDQSRIDDGLIYLRRPVRKRTESYAHSGGSSADEAFGLYVRATLGDKDTAGATRLLRSPAIPIYGKAYLARALAAGVGKKDPAVAKLVGELAQLASDAAKTQTLIREPEEANLEYYMSSSMRTSAMVLGALVDLDPGAPEIAPLVAVLMKHRRKTTYASTQDNIHGLLALNAYAGSLSKSTSKISVEVGGKSILAGALSGKTLVRVGSAPLPSASTLTIKPTGKVHYNVEVRYRERSAELKPESKGIAVTREYLGPDGKPQTSFKLGDVVEVRLSMKGTRASSHLMLSDRLPAGFEALNARFATTAAPKRKARRYWGGSQQVRDHRVDIATEYNWADTYVRSYRMRAIAVGTFSAPPTVAELMYDPAKNARTGRKTVVVKAK